MSLPEAETTSAANEPQPPAAERIKILRRIEWIAAIFLSAAVLFLIITRTICAGPLWRDECDSLQHARMPGFAEVVEYRKFTSFPLLLPIVVRLYTALFGTGDVALRCFGLVVGLLFLAAAWYQARKVERDVPLLQLVLIGLNANFFTTALWIRGYGVGAVSIIFAFALTAQFLLQPGAAMLGLVFVAYLTSMHFLFFNATLVPGIVLAATIVLLLRREWEWAAGLMVVATICGISYVPYIREVIGITPWTNVVQADVTPGLVLRRFIAACGGSTLLISLAWLTVTLFCLAAGAWRLVKIWKTNSSPERDMLLFGLASIPPSVVGYYSFMKLLHNTTLQRHFLALTCVIAVASALIAANFSSNYRLRISRLIMVAVFLAVLPFAPWNKINERLSNIDAVARTVEEKSQPNDLIVVNPSSIGISFNHYYHGSNRWFTSPRIEDHRVHRYDLLRDKMMEFFPLNDVQQEIETTLKAGNRVWIVGRILIPATPHEPLILAPAPDPQFGWDTTAYAKSWSEQLGEFLRRHAKRIDLVVRRGESTNERENLWLIACDGWRY